MKKIVLFLVGILFACASLLVFLLTPAIIDSLNVGKTVCYVTVGFLFIVSVLFCGLYEDEKKAQ